MSVDLAAQIMEGSQRAAARLISWLEDEDERAYECMSQLYPNTGRAYIIGITGTPGAGKSTLTDKLARIIRKSGLKVGIIAVDPSSPFTGGALLGDRVRMSELNNDPDIYIRSMATRGFLGGMSKATGEVVKVLDAFGKDVIIIETVGVGQDEIDIIGIADTTCLVLVPGLGDSIQSMKAGIMEIADIFVINKADKPGADQLCTEICGRLEMDAHIKATDWTPLVNQAIAVEDIGVAELWQAIETHRKFLVDSGDFYTKRRKRVYQETLRIIHNELFKRIRETMEQSGKLDRVVEEILSRERDPYTLMRDIVKQWITIPQMQKEAS